MAIFTAQFKMIGKMKTGIICICMAAAALTACGGGSAATAGSEHPATPVVAGAEIVLTNPQGAGGLTVDEALSLRRSSREYAAEPLSLEELSGVMWAAAGVNRKDGHLTAPSALAFYPVTPYAVLAEGIYRYDAAASKLVRAAEGDFRKLAAMQEFAFAAPLNIVYIADLAKYDERGTERETALFLCGQDAAGYAENVNLYAAGHGLKSITRGSAQREALLETLGLDPERYAFVLAQTVGK